MYKDEILKSLKNCIDGSCERCPIVCKNMDMTLVCKTLLNVCIEHLESKKGDAKITFFIDSTKNVKYVNIYKDYSGTAFIKRWYNTINEDTILSILKTLKECDVEVDFELC